VTEAAVAPPAHPVTEAAAPPPAHPVTAAAVPPPAHPATEAGLAPTGEVDGDATSTATASGRPWPGGSSPGSVPPGSPGPSAPGAQGPVDAAGLYRRGPGVPAAAAGGGQAVLTAEEVWRTGPPGQPPAPGGGRGRWRWAGPALTVVLLIAIGAVAFMRLHHPALQVTGVAITSQVKDGCSVDVTGRISTSGGAGTVSYQWILTPQVSAPHPLSQSVSAGQSTIYLTAVVAGTGKLARQVTLQVLGPGQGRATANVIANC
jgi:hypothetical protein